MQLFLIIVAFVSLLSYNAPHRQTKTNKWFIYLMLLQIFFALLQIHLEENGHADNLIIRPSFSPYNFQIGSLFLLIILFLSIINLFYLKGSTEKVKALSNE